MDKKSPATFTSFEEIFEYAMNEELEAYDFYIAAADSVEDPDLKAFLIELANMETDHYQILKKKLDECRANNFCCHGIMASFGDQPEE